VAFNFQWSFFCGFAAVAGHELIHKKEWYNKGIGTLAYAKFFYTHFFDEHVKGHHRYVATPEDPATSRRNEPFYTFIFRSVYGSHKNTWDRDAARIRK